MTAPSPAANMRARASPRLFFARMGSKCFPKRRSAFCRNDCRNCPESQRARVCWTDVSTRRRQREMPDLIDLDAGAGQRGPFAPKLEAHASPCRRLEGCDGGERAAAFDIRESPVAAALA